MIAIRMQTHRPDPEGTLENRIPSTRCIRRALRVAVFLGALALLMNPSQVARAQSSGGLVIARSEIGASGHRPIAGGGFRIVGTLGQPDAAVLSDGDYVLTGGFWSPTPSANAPEPSMPDPSGLDKTRFISFMLPSVFTGETAVRVRLASLHHVDPPYTGGASVPFTSFEGQVRWVGPPTQYVESSSNPTALHAASLQCSPHYQDWSTVGLLHVTGSAIVPSSVYEVENVAASCAGIEASCSAVSAPLQITTTRWGDVAQLFNPPSATTQPDLADISALVNKFRNTPDAPIKARAFLAGSDAFGNISANTLSLDFDFSHIAACVDGFRGRPYPYTVAACP